MYLRRQPEYQANPVDIGKILPGVYSIWPCGHGDFVFGWEKTSGRYHVEDWSDRIVKKKDPNDYRRGDKVGNLDQRNPMLVTVAVQIRKM